MAFKDAAAFAAKKKGKGKPKPDFRPGGKQGFYGNEDQSEKPFPFGEGGGKPNPFAKGGKPNPFAKGGKEDMPKGKGEGFRKAVENAKKKKKGGK